MIEFTGETTPWVYTDFDESMQTASFPKAVSGNRLLLGYSARKFFSHCRKLYQKNNPSRMEQTYQETIPKIIHQVWLGGDFPSSLDCYAASWLKMHRGRGWRYILWVDNPDNYERCDTVVRGYEELEDLLLQPLTCPIQSVAADVRHCPLVNQSFYDSSCNPGVRSDLVRWEVVNRLGGLYVDTDFECLQAFDFLHHTYDFYTALQPLDTMFAQLGAAMFASTPGHPILNHCVETISKDWHRLGAPRKTGPIHFSKSFLARAGRDSFRDIAFPASYFYPLGCTQSVLDKGSWKVQGALAVHHWAKSWMPKKTRPSRFCDIHNDEFARSWND